MKRYVTMKVQMSKYIRKIDVVVNISKITREKRTRRLVNNKEVKQYQVVYNKRITVNSGEDSIPNGYYWSPACNSASPSVKPIIRLPDSMLYTVVQPTALGCRVNLSCADDKTNDETCSDEEMEDVLVYKDVF